jgi:hypothetical protein
VRPCIFLHVQAILVLEQQQLMLKVQQLSFMAILHELRNLLMVDEATGDDGRILTTVFCGSG